MRNHCSGRTVLISGGSHGIGLALATLLTELGARVAITGRDPQRLQAAAAMLGDQSLTIAADASVAQTWPEVIETTVARWGGIDAYIACHGAGGRIAPLVEQDSASIATTIATNLTAVIEGCRAVLPVMQKAGRGHIITVGSACTFHSWPSWSVYTAAKAGLAGFTRCLHGEMVAWGGKASLFCPGATRTGFQQAAGLEVDLTNYPDAHDMAELLLGMLNVPAHVVVEDLSAWGTAQVLTPY